MKSSIKAMKNSIYTFKIPIKTMKNTHGAQDMPLGAQEFSNRL